MPSRYKSLKRKDLGFTLLELMVATTLFVVITGVVFAVIIATQARYKAEKEYMGAFQQANVAIDQITRDIHGAGFPSKIIYNTSVQGTSSNRTRWAVPVAWAPNYTTNSPCVIGSTCTSPGSFDLILEENQGSGVVWIRYKLSNNILYRGVAAKTTVDPITATGLNGVLVPYLENVMNNASSAEIATITTSYPGTFPGGTAVPVFTFPQYQGAVQAPPNIHNINIALIVQAPNKDLQTQGVRIATFTAQASTINPYQ
jgi:type II secretory pathway component PulJ